VTCALNVIQWHNAASAADDDDDDNHDDNLDCHHLNV